MDEPLKKHGMFSWHELMTNDVEAAKGFYSKVFGWKLEDMPMPGFTYTLVNVEGQPAGGMMKTPPEAQAAPNCWSLYVTVDDVDATAKTVVEQGGRLLVPLRDIPMVGRFCVIQDPQGAVISAITYRS